MNPSSAHAMKKHVIPHKHPRINSVIEADVWFKPVVVIEVLGAEITLSPIHTCTMDVIRRESGLAIRFPRFTGNYRFDKAAEDATTTEEVVIRYQKQLKKIANSFSLRVLVLKCKVVACFGFHL